jgi:hypothetical protein
MAVYLGLQVQESKIYSHTPNCTLLTESLWRDEIHRSSKLDSAIALWRNEKHSSNLVVDLTIIVLAKKMAAPNQREQPF